MAQSTRIMIVTVMAFAAYFLLDELYFFVLREWLERALHNLGLSHVVAYVLVGLPILIAAIYLHGWRQATMALGLQGGFIQGVVVGLVFTLPMFIGYGLVFDLNRTYSIDDFLIGVLSAAIFEEIYFRGFLFGQLYRYSRLGFVPAVIAGALLFGAVHFSQGGSIEESIGVFMVTFFGGLLFAWLFSEWNFNLWVAIFLHMFMNLSWGIFSVGENALGGNYANIFRLMTIALAIGLTVIFKRTRGGQMEVSRKTLLRKG